MSASEPPTNAPTQRVAAVFESVRNPLFGITARFFDSSKLQRLSRLNVLHVTVRYIRKYTECAHLQVERRQERPILGRQKTTNEWHPIFGHPARRVP